MINLIKQKFFILAVYVLLISSLISCSVAKTSDSYVLKLLEQTDSYSVKTTALSFDANFKDGNEIYAVTAPDELCGLRVTKLEEGNYNVSFDGIETALPSTALSTLTNFGAAVLMSREYFRTNSQKNVTKNGTEFVLDFKDYSTTLLVSDKGISEIIFKDSSKTTNYKILTEAKANDKQSRGTD